MAIGILIVILAAALTQPLIEFAIVLNERVALDSAIMNSCRAARNNALAAAYYYRSDRIVGDLNAYIEEAEFRRYFAEALAETLEVSIIDSTANPIKFGGNRRWNSVVIWFGFDYDDDGDFEGHGAGSVTIEVETPYKFRTALLRTAADASGGTYNLGRRSEPMTFYVQVVN